jgi:hypothetical protein
VDVIRSSGRKNAVVIQTALPGQYNTNADGSRLDEFAEDVLSNTQLDYDQGDSQYPELSFKTLTGDVLEITKDGVKTINGERLDTSDWPLLGNPWMHQEMGGDVLRLEYGGETLMYDFKNWKIEGE